MKISEHIYGFLIVPAQGIMQVAVWWLRFCGWACNVKIWPPINQPGVEK